MLDSPWPRRGVDVRREAARARRAHQQPAVLRAGDRDRGAGEVGQHRGAGQGRVRARRHRHPHVLADLDVQHEPGHVGGPEDAGRCRTAPPPRRRRIDSPSLVVARGEPARLVELPVGRQVRLGRDAEHAAAVDHDRAVVEPVALAQRRADDEHRAQVAARRDHVARWPQDRVEQRVLQDQVVDRVAAQAQLGEDRDRDALVVARPRLRRAPSRRWPPGRRPRRHRAGRDPGEPVVRRPSGSPRSRVCTGAATQCDPRDRRRPSTGLAWSP